MVEPNPVSKGRSKLPLVIVCILLLAAIVLAFLQFSGKTPPWRKMLNSRRRWMR